MAAYECLQAGFQRRLPQLAMQAQGEGDVVGGALAQPVEEPQSLLRERERQPLAARDRLDRRGGDGSRAPSDLDRARQSPHRRRLEQRPQGQIHRERPAHLRHRARGGQGVSSELEEAILRADAGHPEDALPDGGHPFFDRRPQRRRPLRDLVTRGRQRAPVHLPARVEGQLRQHHEA